MEQRGAAQFFRQIGCDILPAERTRALATLLGLARDTLLGESGTPYWVGDPYGITSEPPRLAVITHHKVGLNFPA